MGKKRIFMAIPLSYEFRQELSAILEKQKIRMPVVRWVPERNWHITIVPPQKWDRDECSFVIQAVQDSIRASQCMVRTKSIVLGPIGVVPRMIWLLCEPNQYIDKVKREIVDGLREQGIEIDMNKNEAAGDTVHITLARFNPLFKNRIAWLDIDFAHDITVKTVDILQSDLKPLGAEYTRLGEIELQA